MVFITHGQVVTIKCGPKAYQQHVILCQEALIRGQPFEETSFMVGKYISKLMWPNLFPYCCVLLYTTTCMINDGLNIKVKMKYTGG